MKVVFRGYCITNKVDDQLHSNIKQQESVLDDFSLELEGTSEGMHRLLEEKEKLLGLVERLRLFDYKVYLTHAEEHVRHNACVASAE
ncbi:hypothetical protein NDU88_011996 [Pleurodeles waltl]|uniref:Uncharacterized protein n=1 Tax=Pleurodeles waltl TaxID=8319 RepID=A0AAV7QZF5_PLEWA|nr:hypothetical protein NDU88_011996 [Pleurodeles waltl]